MRSYWGRSREWFFAVLCGVIIGTGAALLSYWGNPRNAGICTFIFLRDIAGSLGLHGQSIFAYLRPEIMGIVIGAWLMALWSREFRARSVQAGLTKFVGGLLMILGAAVVIGCPIRLILRLGAGDWTSIVALIGLVVGVWIGTLYLRAGFSMGIAKPTRTFHAAILPVVMLALLIARIVQPPFLIVSETGAGARHTPWVLSLGIGMLIGAFAQRSRFCVTGALRNFIIAREKTLLWGLGATLVSVWITSMITGQFKLTVQGVSTHSDHLWNFLGMFMLGFGAMLVGGCPFRQLVLSAEGDVDAGLIVLGMIFGVALSENVGLSSSSFGATHYGKIAVLLGLILFIALGLSSREE